MRFDSVIMDGIVPEDMPEEVANNEHVVKLLENVDAWALEFDRWIDPESEYYEESLWEERQEGAGRVHDLVLNVLQDAIYRRDVLALEVNLGDIYDQVVAIDTREVANG